MTRRTLLVLVISLFLMAGLIAAGCVQSSSGGQPSGPGTGSVAPGVAPEAGNNGQTMNPPGNNVGAGAQHQFRGSGFLSNTTRLSEAAAKLGVTEEALQEALNGTAGGRPNLTAAAEQLGVTQQQLTDALGIPAGGYTRQGGTPYPGNPGSS